MRVPEHIRSQVRDMLWEQADVLQWASLGNREKARLYESWTKDPAIGGVLARYIDFAHVRVYIKDSLLRDYGETQRLDWTRPFRALGITDHDTVAETYVRPHGRRLEDGRVVAWGKADDWKTILMAVHERAMWAGGGRPFGIVLFESSPRYDSIVARLVVEDAATKLGLDHVAWFD